MNSVNSHQRRPSPRWFWELPSSALRGPQTPLQRVRSPLCTLCLAGSRSISAADIHFYSWYTLILLYLNTAQVLFSPDAWFCPEQTIEASKVLTKLLFCTRCLQNSWDIKETILKLCCKVSSESGVTEVSLTCSRSRCSGTGCTECWCRDVPGQGWRWHWPHTPEPGLWRSPRRSPGGTRPESGAGDSSLRTWAENWRRTADTHTQG